VGGEEKDKLHSQAAIANECGADLQFADIMKPADISKEKKNPENEKRD
jgi:hypothetical protein